MASVRAPLCKFTPIFCILDTERLTALHYKLFIGILCNTLKSINKVLLQCLVLFAISATSSFAIDIIANKSTISEQAERLTTRELRAIFSLKLKQWPDGSPVTVVTLPSNSDLHKNFCKEILNVFSHQLKIGWDRITYSGLGQPPIIVGTAEEMIRVLKATPGAIGYIDNAHIIDNKSVKRVILDGKRTAMR